MMTVGHQRIFEVLAALVVGYGMFSVHVYADENNWGRYEGVIVAKFLDDGRNMQIEKPFKYIDPHALDWDVPAGTVTDGASVPRFFWVLFAPFTGKYRAAAVVHDRFCQTKSRGWRQTHEMFYEAMRASGVDEITAKAMYAAVYEFGPRWGIGAGVRGPGAEIYRSDAEQEEFYRALKAWIAQDNPTTQEIETQLDKGTELPIHR
jgi:endonuclease G, mitochondrial